MTACYLCGVFTALTSAGAATPAPAVRIVSPGQGGLVTTSGARLVVRTGAGVTSMRALLNGTNISRTFRLTGGVRVAQVGGRTGLLRGVNNLIVTVTGSRGRTGFASARFVVARRVGSVLVLRRLLGAASGGPLQVAVGTAMGSNPILRATLNGRRIDASFGLPGPQRLARLGASDGLHFGRNRLRMLFYNERGRYDDESRTIVVPRNRPLAGAGADRAGQVFRTIRLNGRSSRSVSGRRGALSFRWRIVSAPKGARATLRRATSSTPSLKADRIGVYVVGLTVAEQVRGRGAAAGRRVSRDQVVIDDLPDPFPTVGVPFTTLDGSGRMVIDGTPVPSTGGASKISLVVLRRSDRAVISSSNAYDPTTAGIGRLSGDVDNVVDSQASEYKSVAITGTAGVRPEALAKFEAILKRIGVQLASDDRDGLRAGKRFSVIGTPYAPAGSGFVSVDVADPGPCGSDTPQGDLTGLLQKQYSTVPPSYGLVFGQYPTFDTAAPNPPANGNAMRVGNTTYRSALAEGTAGFHVVALDRRTLQPFQFEAIPAPLQRCDNLNLALATNTGNPARDKIVQGNTAAFLREAIDGHALVLIQSIGTPKPTTAVWTKIAEQIDRLGGNRAVFNALGTGSPDAGKGVYAAVGAVGMDAPVSESSQPLTGRPGRLTGVLERSRRAIFQPLVADSVTGTINDKLIGIAYQPARGFDPSFDTQDERNADQWLSGAIHLTPGSVRRSFVIDYTSDWKQAAIDLADAKYPGPVPDLPFSRADFDKVQKALKNDVSAYNRVRSYLDQVRAPLENAGLPVYVKLQQIGTDIQTSINPPAQGGARTSKALKVISGIIGVGTALPPPAGNVATAFSAVFSLASALALPDGSQVGGDISAQVSDLAGKLVQHLDAARKGLQGMTLLIVGDGGKLTDMAAHLTDPDWKLPIEAESTASDSIRKSSARWFYSSLMPAAYQLWQLRGVTNATDYTCKSAGQQHVFQSEPPNGQDLQVQGFVGDAPQPNQVVYALGTNINFHAAQPFARTPGASLVDPLFQPADQPVRYPNGLGMFKPYFYSSVNFPPSSAPDHRSDCS